MEVLQIPPHCFLGADSADRLYTLYWYPVDVCVPQLVLPMFVLREITQFNG